MNSEPVGEIINLLTMKCQVFIPFECKRCGNCCRELGVGFAPLDIHRAANFLKINSKDFINRYLGEIIEIKDNVIHWKETKSRRPCPMLREKNVCTIYPARPGPCRSFPISTDAGDRGIGCLGKSEMIKIRKVLGRGVPYYTSPVSRARTLGS